MTRTLALAALLAAGPAAAADRPNVLFIAVDVLNDWVGCLGKRPDVKTPNIDKLAARGVLFTRAYCAAPACNPSRAALLTGVRPSTSGVYHNDQPWRPVMKDAVTLPQYFAAHGYDVRGGGKVFHNSYNDPPSWAEWFREKGSPEPAGKPANGIKGGGHFDWGPVDARDEDMGDHKTASWAVGRLKAAGDKPFFLAVGFVRPHLPFYAPRKYFDLYPLDAVRPPRVKPDDLADVPPAGVRMAKPDGDHRKVVEHGQWEKAVQAYLACVTFTDAQVGRVLDALAASPHAKNTVVVLWSDHGWHLGEKQHWRKFALWEEATRVTLVAAGPGAAAGAKCGRTVGLLDLYPTLAEWCGLPAKAGLEGASLVPLLKDPQAPWGRPAVTTHGRNNHAVRTERYRYVRYADGSEELYDHDADPLEWANRAGDAGLESVKRELAGHLPKVNAADAPQERKKKG